MHRRILASVALAALALGGSTACSSDDPEEDAVPSTTEEEVQSQAIDPEDLDGVPIEEICTELGPVSEFYIAGRAIGGVYPDLRDFLVEETPPTAAQLRAVAEKSPPDLAAALTGLADRLEVRVATVANLPQNEFAAELLTPDPEATQAIVIINSFTDPQCGFDLPI